MGRGHPESAPRRPAEAGVPFALPRPPTTPRPQPEVSSSAVASRPHAQGLPHPRKESSWQHPGPFDSAPCSEQGGAVSADCPAEGRSQA